MQLSNIDSHRSYGTVCIQQNFHKVVFVHSLMPQSTEKEAIDHVYDT